MVSDWAAPPPADPIVSRVLNGAHDLIAPVTATRAARHRMPGRLVAGGVGAVLIASAALVVALYAADSEPQDAGGIGGPGAFISWLLPLFRLISTLATVGCAGALLAAVVLLRIEGGPLGVQGRRAVRDASNSAIIWAVCAFVGAIVTAAILLNTPVRLLRLRLDDALGVPEVKALLITGILVVALAIGIRRVQTSSAAALGVLVAIAALVPTAVTAYPRNESYVVLAGSGPGHPRDRRDELGRRARGPGPLRAGQPDRTPDRARTVQPGRAHLVDRRTAQRPDQRRRPPRGEGRRLGLGLDVHHRGRVRRPAARQGRRVRRPDRRRLAPPPPRHRRPGRDRPPFLAAS